MELTNCVANLRHMWDIVSGKDTIWTDWVHKNLIKGRDFWSLQVPNDASWYWRRLLEQKKVSKDFFMHIIGDGESTWILSDLWHPKGKLTDWVSQDSINELCFSSDCKVAYFVDEEGWYFHEALEEDLSHTIVQMKEVDCDKSVSDLIAWKPSSLGFTL